MTGLSLIDDVSSGLPSSTDSWTPTFLAISPAASPSASPSVSPTASRLSLSPSPAELMSVSPTISRSASPSTSRSPKLSGRPSLSPSVEATSSSSFSSSSSQPSRRLNLSSNSLLSACMRPINPFDLDDFIGNLTALGKYPGKNLKMEEADMRTLLVLARRVLLQQPTLVDLAAPVNILGDIHGQFDDMLSHFNKLGYPPEANYLFLGDYVDRGKQSLETICLALAYKVKYPNNFFLLRGNHECASINKIYGFYDECKRRYSVKLWKCFTDVFNCLPLAALIEDTIFCMHGGLSPDLDSFDQIRSLQRPLDVPDHGLVCDLLWADPEQGVVGWQSNERGVSWVFGTDVVRSFLQKFDCSLVVRAHQVVEDGYQFFENRGLVTVFSAPGYCGEFDNAGAVMAVSENLTCYFSIIAPDHNRCYIKKPKLSTSKR